MSQCIIFTLGMIASWDSETAISIINRIQFADTYILNGVILNR